MQETLKTPKHKAEDGMRHTETSTLNGPENVTQPTGPYEFNRSERRNFAGTTV